ncbi:hypothetical protein C9I49_17270 [Pseudomonas prosekii]|uniref:Uncharacterized protein n=1 Tax=Pseudomonas prosekii TaxID=1148509 RepID=A0A2U2D5P6_9PSED|nr:hypothetical protein C9I49_17270 [Pseudomonas prosekii]
MGLDGLKPAQIPHPAQIPVGAELARDSGGSVNIDVECAAAFASKLCSYIGYAPHANHSSGTNPCGSRACSRWRWVIQC